MSNRLLLQISLDYIYWQYELKYSAACAYNRLLDILLDLSAILRYIWKRASNELANAL